MRIAEHVYTSQDDIDRIQSVIGELFNGAHVALRLEDGSEVRGIVAHKPTIQQFYDRQGREGSNATVRLETPALDDPEAAGWIDLFLDRVAGVRHLDRHELEPRHPSSTHARIRPDHGRA